LDLTGWHLDFEADLLQVNFLSPKVSTTDKFNSLSYTCRMLNAEEFFCFSRDDIIAGSGEKRNLHVEIPVYNLQ
jgi:hypothetical protein